MAIQTIGTIEGHVQILNTAPASWTEIEGSEPHIGIFDVIPFQLSRLLNSAGDKPVTLRLFSGTLRIIVRNLWILESAPGPNPHISRVKLADRRWFWKYKHVGPRRYNHRRNNGFRGIKRPDQFGLQDVVPRVWYAGYSLKDIDDPNPLAAKWQPDEMIVDVLNEVGKSEAEHRGLASTPFTITIDEGLSKKLPIEDLTIDDGGEAAVARALSYLPEAGLKVTREGDVVVFDRTAGAKDESGGERGLLKTLGYKSRLRTFGHVGSGNVEVVMNELTRPKKIRVLFTREIEVRFDAIEKDLEGSQETGVISETLGDFRRSQNVLPCPDLFLAVKDDVGGGQADVGTGTVPQGTWITFNQALRAWRTQDKPPGVDPSTLGFDTTNIDHQFIRRAYMPFMDLWSALLLVGQLFPDRDWAARVGAIQQNFRRTYRINPRWWDRIVSARAYRVATIDQASGQRAPAPAYTNYAILPGQRSWLIESVSGCEPGVQGSCPDLTYAINVEGYPSDNEGVIDESGQIVGLLSSPNARMAPGEVSIADGDQGIFHIDLSVDPHRRYEQMLPSKIKIDNMPTGNIKDAAFADNQRPIAFNAVIGSNQNPPELDPEQKTAVILTCVPGSPNDSRQLHAVEIEPGQLSEIVEPSVIGIARGPIMEVRVGSGLEVARVRWPSEDEVNRAPDIAKCFGFGEGDPNLKDLVTNGEDADAETVAGGASLLELSKAIAARIYAAMVDRFEGTASFNIAPASTLAGWATGLTHTIEPDGTARTTISLPEKVTELDLLSYLDSSTRAIILKQPQPTVST